MKHFQYSVMGHETFSIFCDGPWDFVEQFRMGHQNFGGNIIFPSGPPWQLLYDRSLNLVHIVKSLSYKLTKFVMAYPFLKKLSARLECLMRYMQIDNYA